MVVSNSIYIGIGFRQAAGKEKHPLSDVPWVRISMHSNVTPGNWAEDGPGLISH